MAQTHMADAEDRCDSVSVGGVPTTRPMGAIDQGEPQAPLRERIQYEQPPRIGGVYNDPELDECGGPEK